MQNFAQFLLENPPVANALFSHGIYSQEELNVALHNDCASKILEHYFEFMRLDYDSIYVFKKQKIGLDKQVNLVSELFSTDELIRIAKWMGVKHQ